MGTVGRSAAAVFAAAGLAVAGASEEASAASATVVSPAEGSTQTVTPAPGFANGDLPLQWTVEYSGCPGSDNIHSSSAQIRPVGTTEWQGLTRGGPFLGPGTFSTPASLFPGTVATAYEWRAFWACGATLNFAGAQGVSASVTFTLLPLVQTPPAQRLPPPAPVSTPAPVPTPAPTQTQPPSSTTAPRPPARTKKAPCAGKKGKARTRCQAQVRRAAQLKRCARLGGARKVRCVQAANAAFRRAVR
jgi:hypothetical protein